MLICLTNFNILFHLLVQLLLIRKVGISTTGHVISFFLLLFLLSFNNVNKLLAIFSLDCLEPVIIVGKLSLASDVQLSELLLMFLLLCNLIRSVLMLGFLVGLLGSELVNGCCTVLGFLLELSQSLHLQFLLLLDSLVLSRLCFLSNENLSLVLGNFVIEGFFCHTSGLFLLESILIGNLDLIVHDLNATSLGFEYFHFLLLHLLNVCLELRLFQLEHFFLLLPLDLPGRNLVDDHLCTSLTSNGCPLLSLVLSLDRLQPLYLHHHVKSPLFINPVLFELPVLLQLLISDCVDLRCQHHRVHVLYVVIVLIQLVLGFGQQGVLAEFVRFDLQRCIRRSLSVLLLHSLFASHSHNHPLCLVRVH